MCSENLNCRNNTAVPADPVIPVSVVILHESCSSKHPYKLSVPSNGAIGLQKNRFVN